MKNPVWMMHNSICLQAKHQYFVLKVSVNSKFIIQLCYSIYESYFPFQRQISSKEEAIESLASRISEKAVDFQHTIEELGNKLEEVVPTSTFQEVGNVHYLKAYRF